MKYELITKPSFTAVGLKWEGTFQQAGAGEIKQVISEMHRRVNEIQYKVNPDKLLGLSYHANPDANGFTHYSVVEVEDVDTVPENMVSIEVPTLQYVKTFHPKSENVQESYTKTYNWIKEQGYSVFTEEITHFEEYPMSQDPYKDEPEFVIMIPVKV